MPRGAEAIIRRVWRAPLRVGDLPVHLGQPSGGDHVAGSCVVSRASCLGRPEPPHGVHSLHEADGMTLPGLARPDGSKARRTALIAPRSSGEKISGM